MTSRSRRRRVSNLPYFDCIGVLIQINVDECVDTAH
jgi:hypothetical protein